MEVGLVLGNCFLSSRGQKESLYDTHYYLIYHVIYDKILGKWLYAMYMWKFIFIIDTWISGVLSLC